MKQIMILILVLVFIIGCSSQQFSNVSNYNPTLDQNDYFDTTITISNNEFESQKYKLDIKCTTLDCQSSISVQSFPSIELEPQTTADIPIRIISTPKAENGVYDIKIEITPEKRQIIQQAHITVTIINQRQSEIDQITDFLTQNQKN